MTEVPLVSVVIATRNRAASLDRVLGELMRQSVEAPFEVVVVDNASNDETSRVVYAWTERDARVRAGVETNLGRATALLEGMRLARGRFWLFTDDDVDLSDGWIEAYANFFERHPDVLVGGPVRPHPDGEWPAWFSRRAAISLGAVEHAGERPLEPGEHLWGANMAAPAGLFERFGAWDPRLGVRGELHPGEPDQNEDVELQYRVREGGGEVWFCPDAPVGHRITVPPPGRCLLRGFGNGRNAAHRRARPGEPEERHRPARSLEASVALGAALARTLVWAGLFRANRRRGTFDRAWAAAWACGGRMEDLLRDGPRDAADRMARRLTARVTRSAAKLAGM